MDMAPTHIDDPLMAYVVRYFAEYQAVVLEDEYGDPHLENNWFPAVFAYHYDAIVASVPFMRERYEAHGRLRELLAELALNPESFWGLTLYLYDYVADACQNRLATRKSAKETYQDLRDFLASNGPMKRITYKAENGKTFTLTDSLLLKYLSLTLAEERMSDFDKYMYDNEVCAVSPADKADSGRKASYFFAQCLRKFLDMKGVSSAKRRQGASISNKEKELILCVLYVCGFASNPENYLDLGYYNKLMKDYEGERMNGSAKYEFARIPPAFLYELSLKGNKSGG